MDRRAGNGLPDDTTGNYRLVLAILASAIRLNFDNRLYNMVAQRRLRQLLTLVEHAHFGRAAAALRISQPALTGSIQVLEAELGVAAGSQARQRGTDGVWRTGGPAQPDIAQCRRRSAGEIN
jgi:hypothetical protein